MKYIGMIYFTSASKKLTVKQHWIKSRRLGTTVQSIIPNCPASRTWIYMLPKSRIFLYVNHTSLSGWKKIISLDALQYSPNWTDNILQIFRSEWNPFKIFVVSTTLAWRANRDISSFKAHPFFCTMDTHWRAPQFFGKRRSSQPHAVPSPALSRFLAKQISTALKECSKGPAVEASGQTLTMWRQPQ